MTSEYRLREFWLLMEERAIVPEFPSDGTKKIISRRALLVVPFAIGGLWFFTRSPVRSLPEPDANGTGESVELMLVDRHGRFIGKRILRKIRKSDAQWRAELAQNAFAVTRRGATEFAFSNRFWNEQRAGVYRCVGCATALFRSQEKFDSGSGWPSFTAPLAMPNIATRTDTKLAEIRTEVLCRKCDAHLGHLFHDGPAPSGLRYCLNSAALVFEPYLAAA